MAGFTLRHTACMRFSRRCYWTAFLFIPLSSIVASGCPTHDKPTTPDSNSISAGLPRNAASTSPISPASQPSPPAQTKDAKPPASTPDVVGSSTAFIGWMNESPVLRLEESLSDGGLRTSFQRLNPDGSLATLKPSFGQGGHKGPPTKNPLGLSQGKLLVKGHTVVAATPSVSLKIEADEHQLEAMQQALQAWNSGKRDAGQGFPSVPAVLSIQLSSPPQPPKTVWKNSTTLAVSSGEAGFEYLEPYLSTAVLSLSGKSLYVEIATGEDVERHLVVMPENPK